LKVARFAICDEAGRAIVAPPNAMTPTNHRQKGSTMNANANILMTDADTRRLRSLTRRLIAAGRSRRDHLAMLGRRISTARIVSPRDIPRNVVTLNSRVRLRDMDSGKRLIVTLADPFDGGIFGDRLSVAGPSGVALLGKRVGQIVHWPLGAKPRRFRIEQVIYQPEAAGRYHL
jgi:regulator of nucleoside diphosphate kinase